MSSIPPSVANLPAAPSFLRTAFRWGVGILVGAWTLLLIVWLTLHWGILPHIQQWRGAIEERLSGAVGVPVRIGEIAVRSHGWVPTVDLRDVTLLDAQGRPALRLPRVVAAVSARSLIAFELHFEQLLLEAPALQIRRDADGRIFVAGLEFSGSDGGSEAVDWLLAQHEFAIRGGTVVWIDERRQAEPLALTDLQLVLRNGLRRHDLRIDATPPAGWGARVSVAGRFTQSLLARRGDWRRWSGTLHANLPHVDARGLRSHVDLPFELHDGRGAVRAWVDVDQGRPRRATLDLALQDVTVRLAADLQPLAFGELAGRLAAQRDEQGVKIAAQRLTFSTSDGLSWPASNLELSLRQRETAGGTTGQSVIGGRVEADRLDLALLAGIAERLPLGERIRVVLAKLAPQGVAIGLTARWEGPIDQPMHYEVRSKVNDLTLAAEPSPVAGGIGRPGLRNAQIEFDASDRGGSAKLMMTGGATEFPGVFADAVVPFDTLSSQLTWRIDAAREPAAPPRIEVRVQDLRFANADASGALEATWRTGNEAGSAGGARFPGVLEMSGRLDRGAAARAARYLPLQLPETARGYVERAVRGGSVASATFKFNGDLREFPFTHARQGEFRIAAHVQDVTFEPAPDVAAGTDDAPRTPAWPAFTQVAGELVFDRASMAIRNARGRVFDFELSGIQGRIEDLAQRPALSIDGAGRGLLSDALRYLSVTPVGAWIGGALSQATATGTGELRLALTLPLDDLKHSTVRGTVTLGGGDVRLRPGTLLLSATRGRVDFTERAFSVVGGAARLLGGEATFEGGSQSDGALRFAGQGIATAEALRQTSELGSLSRLASALGGKTNYRVALGFVHGVPEIEVTSSLVGMTSNLPAPLAKAAQVPLAMRFATRLQGHAAAGAGVPTRDELRFDLGDIVQARYVRDLSQGEPRVLRGGIGVFAPPPDPPSGVHAAAVIEGLDADAWQKVMKSLAATPAAGFAGGAVEGGYLPTAIALRAGELRAGARRLTRVVAGISHMQDAWRANLEADQLAGYLEWRAAAHAPALLFARLSRLALPPADVQRVENLLDNLGRDMPTLDVVVEDFELRGKRLGHVEIEAESRPSDGQDVATDWRLKRLAMTTPEARFVANGQWVPGAARGPRQSVIDFQLDLSDSGAFLERLGTADAVRGGKGRLAGQVAWLGSPLSLDIASLSGNVSVTVDAGQFLKGDAGAGRLLGVLSLQALPRRLSLDFRDVFAKGFAFDNITGDVRIESGVAHTNNLRMRGVQAVVLMDGRADLANETQDLRVFVVPEINAGTAALAYAVINPAVGIATFLAQAFLLRPFMQASTREFHVSGPWADPKVERVERMVGAPIPGIEPADASGTAAETPVPPFSER